MKIITRCVIDMNTLQVIEEDSYIYDGPVAECKGGGGGSTSGKVGFPTYMETAHNQWLSNTGADTLTLSMVDAMNAAHGNSPWTTVTAYDPDSDITAWEAALAAYKAILSGMVDTTDWDSLYDQANTSIDGAIESEITQAVSDFTDQLDDDYETKVLPRFRRGMQDINAVVSSAYPIGEALIESFRTRDVAKFSSSLRIDLKSKKAQLNLMGAEQMLKLMLSRVGFEEAYTKSTIEAKRIKIVAKSDQLDRDAKYDESDALWDLNVFQHGGNLLGAIGSGVLKPTQSQPSTAQSMLGGAMSGAAAGAMVGGPWGAAIGGVLGAASALL